MSVLVCSAWRLRLLDELRAPHRGASQQVHRAEPPGRRHRHDGHPRRQSCLKEPPESRGSVSEGQRGLPSPVPGPAQRLRVRLSGPAGAGPMHRSGDDLRGHHDGGAGAQRTHPRLVRADAQGFHAGGWLKRPPGLVDSRVAAGDSATSDSDCMWGMKLE